jgi:hypothetical protein
VPLLPAAASPISMKIILFEICGHPCIINLKFTVKVNSNHPFSHFCYVKKNIKITNGNVCSERGIQCHSSLVDMHLLETKI